ncbi:endolytic transglycosylase MltG [Fluviicola taffensis]|uniref:Endolytic murein transglycosylase n=1 Tax=Fluviicola taffensis (strain DSM 16823 / NCIMB 13979 / RW262) TaxID=755732 RepID=F2IBQ6_FLUTR|nr:endolytic transglycosylase MltG [Fluviicola taffensis]AEA45382.1 aminodeoxychorismate lyase [Fluviicola taffensis DSM 16823]
MSGKKRNKKVVFAAVVVMLIGVALVFGWTPLMIYFKKTSNDKEARVVIDNRQSLDGIAKSLEKAGVISNTDAFLSMAKNKKVTVENIEPGMYAFPAHTSYRDLLNSLKSGSFEVEVVVTFNNCKTIHDLCVKVSESIMVDSTELEDYILDSETLNKYGFTVEQIPALFMPNSYRMYYDTDKEAFLDRMAKEFKNFWTSERMAKLNEVGLKSPSQAVTLASIVYGEQSKNASEWPVIARLYLNRLNTGMKLQSDPTFKFCWGDQLKGVQRLTYEHRNKDCPYNTYLYNGLPPGPISMPPTGVVDAVLNPDKNDYLYMCAQPNYDGLHNFAKDYADHAKYATEFQTWLSSELANN